MAGESPLLDSSAGISQLATAATQPAGISWHWLAHAEQSSFAGRVGTDMVHAQQTLKLGPVLPAASQLSLSLSGYCTCSHGYLFSILCYIARWCGHTTLTGPDHHGAWQAATLRPSLHH